jgi:hypothetical protein
MLAQATVAPAHRPNDVFRLHRSVRSTIARVDAVALAATIGGSVVALAGVGATAWGAKQQRESAKELEDSRQEHERQLASGERYSEKLSAIYEDMFGLTRRWRPELVAAEPLTRLFAGEVQLPEPPSIDEQNAFAEKLGLFGSTEVGTAYDEFVESLNEFHAWKGTLSATSEMIPGSDEDWNKFEVLRSKALADLKEVEQLARDELRKL